MAIVRIPIPEAWAERADGKHYAIEFDTEKIYGIDMNRDLIPDGEGGKTFAGTSQLIFRFEKLDDVPKWIEVELWRPTQDISQRRCQQSNWPLHSWWRMTLPGTDFRNT